MEGAQGRVATASLPAAAAPQSVDRGAPTGRYSIDPPGAESVTLAYLGRSRNQL